MYNKLLKNLEEKEGIRYKLRSLLQNGDNSGKYPIVSQNG
jgi:hypothetical protein